MTYLPQLRSSLVKAAEQRYGEAPELQKQRWTYRRLTVGGLATACAALVAVAVATVALVALGNHRTSTRAASSPAVTHDALRRAAAQALDHVTLPVGAVASGLVRGTPAELWSPSSRLAIPHPLDVFRVWRIHEPPDRVISFIETHNRAPGSSPGFSTAVSTGESSGESTNGKVVVQQATGEVDLPATRSGVWRKLALNAAALSGGWTALRVDSEAGWLRPRPASELIPSGVVRVELHWAVRQSRLNGSAVITKPGRVHELVSMFNSLPSARPGTGICKSAPHGVIRFRFEGGPQNPPLAVATWAPLCQNLGLTIGGGPTVPVMAGAPTLPPGAQIAVLLDSILVGRRVGVTSRHGSTVHATFAAPAHR